MRFGTLFLEDEELDYYEEDGTYYALNKDTLEKIPLTQVQVAQTVANAWSDDCIKDSFEEIKDGFEAIKFIPIYDWIFFQLYGQGKTKEEALQNVNRIYEAFCSLNDLIEENIERNRVRQALNTERFAILPIDRKTSTLDGDYYDDMELVFFDKSKDDFRTLCIREGIPSDARADEPLTGYVEDNKIIFTREMFISGEFEKYKNTIDKFEQEIVNHYNLKDYELYYSAKIYTNTQIDENGNLNDSVLNKDFDYYTPRLKSKK